MEPTIDFPHDAHLREDPRVIQLIDQHNLEGYGLFMLLLETLRMDENYRMHQDVIPIICRKFDVNATFVVTILEDFDLSVHDDEYYYSKDLCDVMERYDEIMG